MVTAPAAAADDGNKYEPSGVGDMMPSPIKPPTGQGTLFETYGPTAYQLDKQLSSDVTGGDLLDQTMHGVASLLMDALIMVGRAAVTITQWCFNVVSLPEVEPAISRAIGAAATPMATMFLPTALAVGMFIAWARRSDQSMLGQLAWVAASAAIASTFFTSPQTWVNGIDEARKAGAGIAMTTIDGGLSGSSKDAMPFPTPEPAMTGIQKDDTLRKASDAVWRTYVATPWCIADLGSIEACKRWGPELLKRGNDMKDRENYLIDAMNTDTVGHEAVQWRQGHTPSGRIGVLLAALITAVIFAALVIVLAATTLASLLGALMLLVCGVVFACLWCIPGRPRQWGVSWFETLIGLTVVSFTSTMLLGSVMIVNLALVSLLDVYGWLIVSMLNIATAAMAGKLKGKLDGIVSAGGAQLAGRGVLSTVATMASRYRLARRLGSNGSSHRGGGGGLVGMMRRGGRLMGGLAGMGGVLGGRGGRSEDWTTQAPPTTGGSGGDGHTIRVTRARTYPPPPSHAHVPAGSYGNHAATRPGLPGGPGGPSGRGPGSPPGGGPGSGSPARPPVDPTAARSAKTDLARQRAAARGARNGYPVRPGAPDPSGIPHHPRQNGPRVVRGQVVDPPNPVGARFRTYPPAPPQRSSTTRPPAPRSVSRRELPPGRGPAS
ncbi:hypothetical protein ACWGJT_03385 [Streptomyces xantholiticus]